MILGWRAWTTLRRTTPSLLRLSAQCPRPPTTFLLRPKGQSATLTTINTLNHELIPLSNQPVSDLSGLNFTRVHLYLTAEDVRPIKIFYAEDRTTTFPEGTRGHFYYHQDPRFPLVDGAIRFRTLPAESDDFEVGEDLKTPFGKTWERTLYNLRRLQDQSLVKKLVLEKLVHKQAKLVHRAYVTEYQRKQRIIKVLLEPTSSKEQLAVAEAKARAILNKPRPYQWAARMMNTIGSIEQPDIPAEPDVPVEPAIPRPKQKRQGWSIERRLALEHCRLHSKDDTFQLDISRTCHYFHIGDTRLDIWYIFNDKRRIYQEDGSHGLAPYQGKIKARFELLSLQDRGKIREYFVIRVIDVVEPVISLVKKYDGFVNPPVRGQLLTRGLGQADETTAWKLPLDSPRGLKLQPLFVDA